MEAIYELKFSDLSKVLTDKSLIKQFKSDCIGIYVSFEFLTFLTLSKR